MALLSVCGHLKFSVQRTLWLRGSLMNLDIYRATPESRWMACCLCPRQLNLNISILNPAKCHWNWEQSADIPMLYEICSSAERRDGTCMFSLRRPGPHVLSFSFPAEGPQTLNSCWLINTRLFSKDVLFPCKASAGYAALKSKSFYKNSSPFGFSARTPVRDRETRARGGALISQGSFLQKKWMPIF